MSPGTKTTVPTQQADGKSVRPWRILLIVLGLVYLLQIGTPLRLGADSVVLMSEAESVAAGTGFLDHGIKTPFPPGYPAVLAALLKLGLAHPYVLIAFNLILLGVGLAALLPLLQNTLGQPESVAWEILCAFLLSYVVVKHTAMPLTDVPFFGLSVACLATLVYAEGQALGKRFYLAACLSGVLFLCALSLRMVGIALAPAFLWMVLRRKEVLRIWRTQSAKARMTIAVLVALIVSPIALFRVWNYTTEVYRVAARGTTPLAMARDAMVDHTAEIGELAANVPQRQLPLRFQVWPLFCAGIAMISMILLALWRRFDRIGVVDIYFVAYAGIILVWPYRDPRFWIPVLPFVMVYCRIGLTSWLRDPRWTPLLWGFKSVFALTGLVAIIYTTRLSFSGSAFPGRYATGAVRATYCAALNSCAGDYDKKEIDAKILHVLQTYK